MTAAICAVLLALMPSLVLAQQRELEEVHLEEVLAASAQRSLELERALLLERGAHLSDTIDSLKIAAPVSHEFTEARLLAMELNQQLSRVHQRLDSLEARQDSLRSRRLTMYAWEISRLMGLLSDNWDDGLAEQLSMYLREREDLGYGVAASQMRYGEELALRDDDGPTQINQKIGLLQDRLGVLRGELSTVERRMQRLTSLTSQMQVIQRRWLHRRGHPGQPLESARQGVMTDARVAALSGTGQMAETRSGQSPTGGSAAAPRSLVAVREHAVTPGAPMDEGEALILQMLQKLQLEVFRLTARQQAVRESEGVLLERIQAFELRRRNLLDGRE